MTVVSEAEGLVSRLRDQGFKITSPRSQVVERVASRDDNFTAEELAAELAPIGRATVYRTLKLLLDQGLVCLSCGATEDVHLADVETVLARVREATEYDVVDHRIEVYGLCPRCKRRGAKR